MKPQSSAEQVIFNIQLLSGFFCLFVFCFFETGWWKKHFRLQMAPNVLQLHPHKTRESLGKVSRQKEQSQAQLLSSSILSGHKSFKRGFLT